MHILCCLSHMATELYSIAPIGFAIKKNKTSFSRCPFYFAHWQLHYAFCCSREKKSVQASITTDEPLRVFLPLWRSFPWNSHESSCIDFSDLRNVQWSLLLTPTSVLTLPASASAAWPQCRDVFWVCWTSLRNFFFWIMFEHPEVNQTGFISKCRAKYRVSESVWH